ncbi:MAG: DUF6569 family protein [Fimbriimonadaceae bacterium]
MKKLFPLALAVILVGCSSSDRVATKENAAIPAKATGIEGFSRLAVAGPIEQGNVTIYPVTSTQPSQKEMDDMVTLDEAKRKNWVEITEQEDETVETLEVKNTGPQPILLMGGEILLGGKQDRIVSKDTVVKPGETVKVPVYCVDQGRWTDGAEKFEPSGNYAPSKVRKAAVIDKDQNGVWSRVAAVNRSGGVPAESSGGSESIKVTLDSKAVQARQADANTVVESLRKQKNVVGIVVVVNGEIQGFEYFGSNKLFNKAVQTVLKGAFTDSLVAGKATSSEKISVKDASAFVADCLKGENTYQGRSGDYAGFLTNGSISEGVTLGARAKIGEEKKLYRGSFFKK